MLRPTDAYLKAETAPALSQTPLPMKPAPRVLGRVPALDGLRALAILAVFGVHLQWTIGGNGVTVFFALSGFLITAILLDEIERTGRIQLGRFFVRRVRRLLPALLAFLIIDAIYIACSYTGWDRKAMLMMAALTPFYANNWLIGLRAVSDNHLSHTWSLAVEEQFYLVWPFVLLAIVRLAGIRRAGFVVLALAVLAVGWRFAVAAMGGSEYRIYNGTDTRIDAVLFGAVTAFAFRYRILPESRAWRTVAVIACIALVLHLFAGVGAAERSLSLHCLCGYALVAMLACVAIVLLAEGRGGIAGRWLAFAPLVYIGKLSYGLYLWHYLIFYAIQTQFPTLDPVAAITMKLALTSLAAVISYHVIERPFLKVNPSR